MRTIILSLFLFSSWVSANEFVGIYIQAPNERTEKVNELVKTRTGEDISYKAIHIDEENVSYYWGKEALYTIPYKIYGNTLVAYPGNSSLVFFKENKSTLITTGFKYVKTTSQ
ncbi:hypothetical protein O0V09_18755 [Dasania sp. GY-19]|uniref:Uncharacterized protein n=1 Tax=Dasania phycosphaerae TaxID=2950436 RepID=A0A9J6RS96_9GAMM|nr:hypothetical protein [Dasania phycosphaerae]MCZ0867242.1 hypothetical protein [Dasania phycosphaerae]